MMTMMICNCGDDDCNDDDADDDLKDTTSFPYVRF